MVPSFFSGSAVSWTLQTSLPWRQAGAAGGLRVHPHLAGLFKVLLLSLLLPVGEPEPLALQGGDCQQLRFQRRPVEKSVTHPLVQSRRSCPHPWPRLPWTSRWMLWEPGCSRRCSATHPRPANTSLHHLVRYISGCMQGYGMHGACMWVAWVCHSHRCSLGIRCEQCIHRHLLGSGACRNAVAV